MKTISLWLFLAGFLIGAVVGGWGISRFWTQSNWDLSVGSLAAEASTSVSTLKSLRYGNTTGAVELLEIKLDGALIGLGAMIPEMPESRHAPLHLKAVEMAREYRAEFPRTNDSPELANGVARAFSLLDEQPQD